MEKNLVIKEKVEKILKEITIETLANEKEIIKILERIENNDENELNKFDEDILNNIEEYLIIKQKMKIKEKDYKFMHELSSELKEQKIRKGDALLNIPLFKIVTSDKNEYYFLTRNNAIKFMEDNKSIVDSSEVIKIVENKNLELARLIDIIKNNY